MFIIFFMNAVVQSIFPMLNEGLAPVYLICVMFALVSYALNHYPPALYSCYTTALLLEGLAPVYLICLRTKALPI